jgi:hypothetical protein
MPANFISQPIPMLLPSDGTLLVTRDDAAGTAWKAGAGFPPPSASRPPASSCPPAAPA